MKTKVKSKTKLLPYQKASDAFLAGATSGRWQSYAIIDNYLVNEFIVESSKHCTKNECAMFLNMDTLGTIRITNKDELNERLPIKNYETHYVNYLHKIKEVIAKRQPDGTVIVNSSGLRYTDSRVTFGHHKPNRGVTKVQQYLIDKKLMAVPFVAFEQAKLDIEKLVIVQRGAEEIVKEKYKEYNKKTKRENTKYRDRHFTGATLFAIDDSVFLFDLDRRETQYGIINPFIVELPFDFKPVNTISKAYDSLIPDEVRKAMDKGLKVERQGEWFFIPTKEVGQPDIGEIRWNGGDRGFKRLELRVNNNRPNYTEQCIEAKGLVRGKVTHSGREHEPLDLGMNVWYKPVPNTASKSFTITGDVD